MNELSAEDNTRGRIETTKDQQLNRADWKVDSERRDGLNDYKKKLDTTAPNMPASRYISPPGTQYDITKVSRSKGIRCMQLETNEFNHKVPVDRILMSLELARPHDDPSQVMFPYGFTEKVGDNEKFNVTNVIMPLPTFEGLSKDIADHFDSDRVYNQSIE